MSDTHRDYDEQLPWLQAVEDEDGPRGISARKMLAALLMVMLAGVDRRRDLLLAWAQRCEGSGPPELIHADVRPYKVKPADPGGLDVAGESETAFETSAGEDKDAQLDLSKLPETPVAKPAPQPTAPPAAAEKPAAPEPEPAAPSGAPGSVDPARRLRQPGAGRAGLDRSSTRFPTIGAMNKMIVPFSGGIRLRAGAGSPADAKAACQALKVAGENCFVAH